MYSVNYWESHPDCDNDDCSMGFDFDNKEEALAKYHETPSALTAYVEITANILIIDLNPMILMIGTVNKGCKPRWLLASWDGMTGLNFHLIFD